MACDALVGVGPRFVLALILALGLQLIGRPVAAAEPSFRPDLEKALPQLGEATDLSLFKAGKALKRWQRAEDLRRDLPPSERLEPFHNTEALLKWLAAVALTESAVTANPSAPVSWEKALLADYARLADKESVFSSFRSVVGVMSVQRGSSMAGLSDFAGRLYALAAYGRRGVEWMASRHLAGQADPALQEQLLGSLIAVYRREGRFEEMRKAAVTWADVSGKPAALVCAAEAAFELGLLEEGDAALAAARKVGSGKPDPALAEDLARAETRRRLQRARQELAKGKNGARQAAVFRLYAALHEPWRILSASPVDQVASLGHAEVDELYLDALLSDNFDFQSAWRYGSKATGAPLRPGFLGRRIGAGLAMILKGLFSQEGQPAMDAALVAAIRKDLGEFRKAVPRLADLTDLYLVFVQVLIGRDVYVMAREIGPQVTAFVKAYPDDLAGAQMAFLIGMLDPAAPQPWQVLQAHVRSLGKREPEAGFVPLYAGAAVRQAVRDGKATTLDQALGTLDRLYKTKRSAEVHLWRAHLLATRALLAEGQVQGQQLQAAVDAYGQTIRAWGETPDQDKTPAALCMATVSLATLLMQGQALSDARDLLLQSAPVCGNDAESAALAAVFSVAQGQSGEGEDDPLALLARAADAQSSRQVEIQSRLWLGLVAEANQDQAGADRHFRQAAELLQKERERGSPLVLAPDLRSLVAQSGQFDMGSGHAPDSPFGLALQISVTARMVLFPPAAVTEEKLSKYMKKKDKK